MGKTSTAVKRKYNDKTYTRWFADLRNEDFQRMESLRGEKSRAQFLKDLVDFYTSHSESGRLRPPAPFCYPPLRRKPRTSSPGSVPVTAPEEAA